MSDGLFASAKVGVEPSLGYYLSTARNVLATRIDRAVAPLGLTSSQIGVILLLWYERARTPNEMSRVLSYDTGSMTRMLDRLERKGFLVRQRSQSDRRVVELALTEQGRDAAQQLPALVAAEMTDQLRGFAAEEIAMLVSLLQRFIANDASTEPICRGGTAKAEVPTENENGESSASNDSNE